MNRRVGIHIIWTNIHTLCIHVQQMEYFTIYIRYAYINIDLYMYICMFIYSVYMYIHR